MFGRLWPNNCQKIIIGFNHYTCVFYCVIKIMTNQCMQNISSSKEECVRDYLLACLQQTPTCTIYCKKLSQLWSLSWYSRVAVVNFSSSLIMSQDFGDGKKASQRSTWGRHKSFTHYRYVDSLTFVLNIICLLQQTNQEQFCQEKNNSF